MSALDVCEPEVIRAFEKAGWHIDQKPFTLRFSQRSVYADFSLQYVTEDEIRQIVVIEVKCFQKPNADLPELYNALGQYLYYEQALIQKRIDFPLYLTIPDQAYKRLEQDPNALNLLNRIKVKIVIVDIENEEIVRWIN